MTSLREAAQQALEALESCQDGDYTTGDVRQSFDEQAVNAAIVALWAALAQQPPVPPDACPVCHGVGYDSSGQLCGCQDKPSPCAYPNCVGGQAGTICKPSCPGGTK